MGYGGVIGCVYIFRDGGDDDVVYVYMYLRDD